MSSRKHHELASRLRTEFQREFGDYPHWNDSDIFDMLEEGVDQGHIKAEWLETVMVYNGSAGGAEKVFSRLRKLDVDRPDINDRTVADWLGKGLSELIITLEYLRSTSAPSLKDAAACLTVLERRFGPCSSVTEEEILKSLMSGTTGQDLAARYSDRKGGIADNYRSADTGLPGPISDEDLWVEMHYNLLYATTQLPSAPVIFRSPHRSHRHYNEYFHRQPHIDLDVFLAKSQYIVPTTIVKLDRRLEKFIKEGGHPKALRTYITSDRLDAYRKIHDKIGAHMIGLDVEN